MASSKLRVHQTLIGSGEIIPEFKVGRRSLLIFRDPELIEIPFIIVGAKHTSHLLRPCCHEDQRRAKQMKLASPLQQKMVF